MREGVAADSAAEKSKVARVRSITAARPLAHGAALLASHANAWMPSMLVLPPRSRNNTRNTFNSPLEEQNQKQHTPNRS